MKKEKEEITIECKTCGATLPKNLQDAHTEITGHNEFEQMEDEK